MTKSADQIELGRTACANGAWRDAYDALSKADRSRELSPEDVARLATAAYMLGLEDEFQANLERVHHKHLQAGDCLPAARSAFWLCMHLFTSGEVGQATGWLARAERLVAREQTDCVERGYLLLPMMFEREAAGDLEAAEDLAGQAVTYGERFADADLFALAAHSRGHLLIQIGSVDEGCRLLDEAMVSVTSGELSPNVSGIVYCGVILACQDAFDLRRAREWTAALSRWCERQPDMVAFTGRCLVHRAEILQHDGAWEQAMQEAQVAVGRCAAGNNRRAEGEAAYIQGELHRLQGDPGAAEQSYREAGRCGREPQPGLALLRVSQGEIGSADASIRRALEEATDRARRAALLPAAVEIALLAGDTKAAGGACAELDQIAAGHERGILGAAAAQARGALQLVEGDASAALLCLRRAVETWEELRAPYESARSRVLLALACRDLGDQDAARLELDCARDIFTRLGTADGGGITSISRGTQPPDGHDLTDRELEVLRLIAAGDTNRAIAAELVISERTVHRHVSNIFAKLRVSSRSAATAYAYEHDLV